MGVVLIGGGEATTGALTAAIAVGAVLASALSGGLAGVRAQGKVIVGAIAVFAGAVIAFGVVLLLVGRSEPDQVVLWALVAAVVALGLAGAADSVSSIFRRTILQAATPDALRGRLQGVFVVVVAGGPRLGDVVVGAQASWFGEGLAAVVGGLACLLAISLLALTQRRFLAYDGADPTG